MRTNIGVVKVKNESNIEGMTEADHKLIHYFNGLMQMVEKTSKSGEDSILLAGAMINAARLLYYDQLGPTQGQELMDNNMEDFVHVIKPTIH